MLGFAAAEILAEVGEIGADRGFVHDVGIEVGIIPLDHAVVVEVLRVGERLQEGLVADRATDVRRRAAALRADEAGGNFYPAFPVPVLPPHRSSPKLALTNWRTPRGPLSRHVALRSHPPSS